MNMLNAFVFGQRAGRENREYEQMQEDRNTLRTLTPAALGGDMAAQDRITAIDPNHGAQVQATGDRRLQQLRGFIEYVDRARATGNTAAVNAALQTGAPFLSQFMGGRPPPTQWTPDMDAGWEQLKAKVAMAAQPNPADPKVLSPGAAMVDASGNVIFQNPAVPTYSVQQYTLPDGSIGWRQIATRGEAPGTAHAVGPGGGMPAPAPQAPPSALAVAGPDGQTVGEFAALPAAVRMRAAELEAAGQPFHIANGRLVEGLSNGVLSTPPAAPPSNGFGQTDADRAAAAAREAAAVEAAKHQTGLDFSGREADAAAEAARQKKEAELLAERNAAADKRASQADASLGDLQRVIELLPGATGSTLGMMRDRAAAITGESTAGGEAAAQLRILAARLVANVPRFEGPQSNIDVQFYKDAAGDLANDTLPVGQRLAAARLMLQLAQKYATQQPANGAPPAGNAPQPGTVEDGYQYTGGDPSSPTSWIRLR